MKIKSIMLGLSLLLLGSATFIPIYTARAQSDIAPLSDVDLPICQPGLYAVDPGDCLPLGPSQTIKALKEKGLPFRQTDLPARKPDPNLSKLPIYIARVESGGALPVYRSFDDAAAGAAPIRTIMAGPMRYVTMINQASSGGTTFVMMETGEWVQATPHYSYNTFQGLEFTRTPKNDFGWTVNPTPSYSGPGFKYPVTGKEYAKYALYQIYDVQEADGYEWYEIGPDEWINSLKGRRVPIDPTRPEGVEGERWIKIDLYNQVLSIYEKGQFKFASLIASGLDPFFTQPGAFQIYKIYETVTMQDAYEADRSDYYQLQGVPWAMFYDRNTAIHGIYWPAMLGFPQSHGCVNMTPGDAKWVYDWAEEGDWVYVFDSSGKTPTDSPLYGGSNDQ